MSGTPADEECKTIPHSLSIAGALMVVVGSLAACAGSANRSQPAHSERAAASFSDPYARCLAYVRTDSGPLYHATRKLRERPPGRLGDYDRDYDRKEVFGEDSIPECLENLLGDKGVDPVGELGFPKHPPVLVFMHSRTPVDETADPNVAAVVPVPNIPPLIIVRIRPTLGPFIGTFEAFAVSREGAATRVPCSAGHNDAAKKIMDAAWTSLTLHAAVPDTQDVSKLVLPVEVDGRSHQIVLQLVQDGRRAFLRAVP